MIRASNLQAPSETANLQLWPRVRTLLAGHGPLRTCAAQILSRLFVDAADVLCSSSSSSSSSIPDSQFADEICLKWIQVLDECTQSEMVNKARIEFIFYNNHSHFF